MDSSALTTAITSITGALTDFSGTNVTSVIVAGLGIAVPLVLVWFAFRWIYRKERRLIYGGILPPFIERSVFMIEPDLNLKGLPDAIRERFYSGEKKDFPYQGIWIFSGSQGSGKTLLLME